MTRATIAAMVGLLAVSAGLARATQSSPPRYVPCADVIGQARGPHDLGYRLVLGVMSVPPAYMPQGAVRVDGFGRWTYWRKTGMVVRGGNFTVVVTVPKAWRSRAAITWGNGGSPIVSSLRFTGCGNDASTNQWSAYAGGFYLRSRVACVPLVFRLGDRSVTVRFGIGTRCPS